MEFHAAIVIFEYGLYNSPPCSKQTDNNRLHSRLYLFSSELHMKSSRVLNSSLWIENIIHRRMKRVNYLLAIISLSACSVNELPDNPAITPEVPNAYISVIDSGQTINSHKIEQIATAFWTKECITRNSNKTIANIESVKDANDIPLFYIVNYSNDQGFIIISAKQNYKPILAYSDKGHFDMANTDKTGVSIWLKEQQLTISTIDELPDSIQARYKAMWTRYNTRREPLPQTRSQDDVMRLISTNVHQWEQEGYTVYRLSDYKNTAEFKSLPQEVQNSFLSLPLGYANPNYGGRENVSFILSKEIEGSNVNPLIKTTWDQYNGYNMYTGGAPLGCVAVAMAQIMKYHTYPIQYNWSAMANTYATSTTAEFIAGVGKDLGMRYEQNDTGATIDEAEAVFKKYGYTNCNQITHNTGSVCHELDLKRPVYMRGTDSNTNSGHAWVCDGYNAGYNGVTLTLKTLEDCPSGYEPSIFLTPYTYEHVLSYYGLYHMNWGYNGLYDGYYWDNNIKIGNGANYSNKRKDIINIYPIY